MAAALCLPCFGRTDGMTCKDTCSSCLTVFGIGVLQLLLVACFLIGWIWSCIWGVTFIGMSATFYDDERYEEDHAEAGEGERDRTHSETNGAGAAAQTRRSRRLPTPQVIEDQPYPGIRYGDIQQARGRRRRENRSRRTRSRISITPSTLIYPMRAPSNIAYNSPPPTYQESEGDRRSRPGQSRSRSNGVADRNINEDRVT